MFSPYYAAARRRAADGCADPLAHCALNVALYRCDGAAGTRWAMTERGARALRRDAQTLQIGPSALRWGQREDGDTLTIEIDEVAVPWPSRLRGTVRLRAPRRFDAPQPLAPGHRWCPIAPAARVEVDLAGQRWGGAAYLDANHGDTPLEHAFARWDWSRAALPGGAALVLYDVTRRDGTPLSLALRFDADGMVTPVAAPPVSPLPHSGWRVARGTRSEAGAPAALLRTLTDAPFYARSLVRLQWQGQPIVALHESLSLARFDTRWVQALLPFRMPRRAG